MNNNKTNSFYPIRFLVILFMIFIIQGCKLQTGNAYANIASQMNYINTRSTNSFTIEEDILRKSKSGNAYLFMSYRSYLGGMNTLIKGSNNNQYIKQQCALIDNIINSSKPSKSIVNNLSSYNDNYRSWISMNKENGTYGHEIVLYESYSFFYITQFLYLLKKDGWMDNSIENKEWWEQTLNFVEKHIWEKWYERCLRPKGNHYWYFLRNRTHMGSHWAGLALYLEKMTTKKDIYQQSRKLIHDYDILLKRNLKPNPLYPSAYIWNSTYDNTDDTYASETKPSIIQDVSHGNHVVSYIIAAYEMDNSNWSLNDIKKLCNTLKKVIYNKKSNSFADNVDGTSDPERPGWGNFISDGWIKLSKYDKEVAQIFKISSENKLINKRNDVFQWKVYLKNNSNY